MRVLKHSTSQSFEIFLNENGDALWLLKLPMCPVICLRWFKNA